MKNRIDTARVLASDIDRLAYLVNPCEYNDTVDDIEDNKAQIVADLLAGDCQGYIEWLTEVINDENNDKRDRQRAAGRLARVLEFVTC